VVGVVNLKKQGLNTFIDEIPRNSTLAGFVYFSALVFLHAVAEFGKNLPNSAGSC